MSTRSKLLPPWARLLAVASNLTLGLLPSVLFFAWIERNCTLPYVPIKLGWPWISLATEETWVRALIDIALLASFGLLHTTLAQDAAQKPLRKILPSQLARTFYVSVTGLSLLAVMGFWQSTGILLWTLPLRAESLLGFSTVFYWALLLTALAQLRRFDPLQFIGLKQIYAASSRTERTEGTPTLIHSGLYARVRHPIYLFMLAAFVLTPFLSLDRALVFGTLLAYLIWAIPIEERKLELIFGKEFSRYRERVPALFPRVGRESARN